MWQSCHRTLCQLTICQVIILPVDNFASCWHIFQWQFCQSTYLPVDIFASWPFCQLTLRQFTHCQLTLFYLPVKSLHVCMWVVFYLEIIIIQFLGVPASLGEIVFRKFVKLQVYNPDSWYSLYTILRETNMDKYVNRTCHSINGGSFLVPTNLISLTNLANLPLW